MAEPSNYSSVHRIDSLAAGSAAVIWDEGTNSEGHLLAHKFTLPVISSSAYSASITPDIDGYNMVNVGTLTGNITINNPSGSPVDGQKLLFRFAQDGTGSRTISFGAAYAFGTDVTTAMIPSTASAKWEMGFQYHAGDSKWRAVAIARGF